MTQKSFISCTGWTLFRQHVRMRLGFAAYLACVHWIWWELCKQIMIVECYFVVSPGCFDTVPHHRWNQAECHWRRGPWGELITDLTVSLFSSMMHQVLGCFYGYRKSKGNERNASSVDLEFWKPKLQILTKVLWQIIGTSCDDEVRFMVQWLCLLCNVSSRTIKRMVLLGRVVCFTSSPVEKCACESDCCLCCRSPTTVNCQTWLACLNSSRLACRRVMTFRAISPLSLITHSSASTPVSFPSPSSKLNSWFVLCITASLSRQLWSGIYIRQQLSVWIPAFVQFVKPCIKLTIFGEENVY